MCIAVFLISGCAEDSPDAPENDTNIPEHHKRFGIYSLELGTGVVKLIYSSDNSLHRIHANSAGTKIVFREDFGSDTFRDSEICIINPDGSGYQQLTNNTWLDAYPSWSPDGSKILFLSWPDYPNNTLDIFLMDFNGANPMEFYDSGFHDADCHWVGSKIVFTRESQIWIMNDNGTNAMQVTDYELAGQQGNADVPFGDYDPRLNPTGTVICFDRMVDDQSTSGNYNFYTVNTDGTGETAITSTGWQQFMAEWSNSGNLLLFTVAAKNGDGIYDMYTIKPDGSELTNITPAHWPVEFLCTHGIFSYDDSKIYFVGEWYE
jgi:Tol biopolymer transport system component